MHPDSQAGSPEGQSAESLPPETASADVPGSELDNLRRDLAAAVAAASEANDQFLRSRAEMENIRRRAQEEVTRARKYAIEPFAESLLPVRDSLEAAIRAASDAGVSGPLREGVEATLQLLAAVFDKNKVLEINPVGLKLDPNQHQAISTVPAASTEPPVAAGHVVMVLQKGYLLNDRVLRPALVTVAQ